MENTYRIAELVIRMKPEYAPLLPQSEAYRYDGREEYDYRIHISEEMYLEYEKRFPEADRPLIEYMMTGAQFYSALIHRQGLLLHASAVELDGKAYLFSAPSGTGKSTHTSLWLKEFAPRARILNDDKPALRLQDGKFYVYGTPWSGKSDQSLNLKVPLQGIAFLSRGEENRISHASSLFAIRSVLEQTVRPKEPSAASMLMDLINQLVQYVPIYTLQCNMEPEAAHVSYQTMLKGEML